MQNPEHVRVQTLSAGRLRHVVLSERQSPDYRLVFSARAALCWIKGRASSPQRTRNSDLSVGIDVIAHGLRGLRDLRSWRSRGGFGSIVVAVRVRADFLNWQCWHLSAYW